VQATISFPRPGQIAGQATCNRCSAVQAAPYPWFLAESIGATGMACPELDAEQDFLGALATMTFAEIAGDTLILSNTDGRQMVFAAQP
jgi:heat shock protein HslJ